MQFNVVLRTGGLAINREFEEKEGNDGIILTVEDRSSREQRQDS